MKKWVSAVLVFVLAATLVGPLSTVRGQDGCGNAPPPRLTIGGSGAVSYTDGQPLRIRDAAGMAGAELSQLPEGTLFLVLDGPVCADDIYWWQVQAGDLTGWVAEGVEGAYFVEPKMAATGGYGTWNWEVFKSNWWMEVLPDPMLITLPPTYAGDMPTLPVDLGSVRFVDDAGLNEAQKALLAQNGFVVIPGGFDQFHEAYREDENWSAMPPDFDWETDESTWDYGHAFFVTTDSTLHMLHFIFDNLLSDLEKFSFQPTMWFEVLYPALTAAHEQTQQAAGTPLEEAARAAELYLTVAAELFVPGGPETLTSPDIYAQAQEIAALAVAGEGQLPIPFLTDYVEDFSQYRPRGHYAGDATLEQYFRGMMWMGRITFLAKDDEATLMALLLLRTLTSQPDAFTSWQNIHDTLTFLIGPSDDLSPLDYYPIAQTIYGGDLPLETLADASLLPQFLAEVEKLPAPKVNGLIIPADSKPEDIGEETRGFRLMGQRFTFDAYLMGQLMFPYVGTLESPRILPTALDVASVMGSESAGQLATEAGATDFANYQTQLDKLKGEFGALTDDQWLENTYGGWLWTLKPLFDKENLAAYPPMMNTEAWARKDLQAGLASWTELKHDTVLYVKQPGGAGGGGPPLTSFGYVEPNPLVFARIAIVAATLYQGLEARGLNQSVQMGYSPAFAKPDAQGDEYVFQVTLNELRILALKAAQFAETARKELAGETVTEDEYWGIYGYANYMSMVLHELDQSEDGPDPVALVTDVANNPDAGVVLQEGVGKVDYIYAVVPAPKGGGYQMVRGGVFTYYEFVNDINQRMTDEEWRALVASGDVPARPAWISAFYSE